MKSNKKQIRKHFREVCLERDKHKCAKCGYGSTGPGLKYTKSSGLIIFNDKHIEVHHITDRSLMPDGGYVLQNGISLCPDCHLKAEMFHSTGVSFPGYSPEDLYAAIGSSKEEAINASNKHLQVNRKDKV